MDLKRNNHYDLSFLGSIIENNKTDFALSKNRLYQRAVQYASGNVSSDVQQLKSKLGSIEGPFADKRIAAKEKEIMEVRVKLSKLNPPVQPEDPPKQPIEPVLRKESELPLEVKVGKDEVLEVFNALLHQSDEETGTDN